MFSDLKNNISSFFKDMKKEKTTNNIQYQNISNLSYASILSRLKKQNVKDENDLIEWYIDQNDKCYFHIKDETLAKTLYQSIKNENIFETIPDELKGITFVFSDKKEKILFITCRHVEETYTLGALSNFYDSVKWICDNLSTLDTKIYIDLHALIYDLTHNNYSLLASLLCAITLKEYTLDKTELINIIDRLFYNYSSYNYDRFVTLKEKVITEKLDFYKAIRNGVYIDTLDNKGFNKLPVYLYVNMFRYAISSDYFTDLNDFFNHHLLECAEEKLVKEQFIFYEEMFLSSLNQVSENENYIVYRSKDVNTHDYYYKVKNTEEIDNIEKMLWFLYEEMFIDNYKVLYSLETGNYYIAYENSKKNILLSSCLATTTRTLKMHDAISLINNAFLSNTDIRNSIYVGKNTDLTKTISIDTDKNRVVFRDLSLISFKETDNFVKFEYPLLIMQLVKKFVEKHNINIDDIYGYYFMNMFTHGFAEKVIHYLNTSEYNSHGMISRLTPTLDAKYVYKVEFLEDISIDDKDIENISFLNGITLNDKIQSIVDYNTIAKSNLKPKLSDKYISLDEITQAKFMDTKDVLLSNTELDKIFYKCKLSNTAFAFIPKSVIISRDPKYLDSKGNYKILGIVWSKSNLYKLSDVLASKVLNTSDIYKIVSALLYVQSSNLQYSISNAINDFSGILIDDKLEVYFDCSNLNNVNDLFSNTRTSKIKYYTYMMNIISTQYKKIDLFPYDKLFKNCKTYGSFRFAAEKIIKCPEHNSWYLKGEVCPMCESQYLLVRRDNYEGYYFRDAGGYYYQYSNALKMHACTIKRDSYKLYDIEQIKLALENDLYQDYDGLVPEKIIFEGARNYAERKMCGIAYAEKYNFDDVVELKSFKGVNRFKAVLLLYKKILPLIKDGTFISSHKLIFKTMFMDKTQKGKIIIPDLALLDSRTILSENQDVKKTGIDETLKMFATFLHHYIMEDEVVKYELDNGNQIIDSIIQQIDNLEFDDNHIKEYLSTKDAYCKVHGVHFQSSQGICPQCIVDGISKEVAMIRNDNYFEMLKTQKPSYEGGEANLYPYDDKYVQKIFDDGINRESKSKIIGKALQKTELFKKFNEEHEDIKFVCINKVLYSYKNNMLNLEGYTEEYIKDSFKISSLKDKEFVASIGYTRKDVIEILIKVCEGIEFLHSINGYIGDLNGGNIVIKDKVVYFIDVDGMSLDDVKNCVYTNMYIYPPSAESKNITAKDDWYSFAVQAFYYLTYSHPFRGVCNRYNVPVNEMERMTQGMSVLGRHGIKVPNISIGWTFMPKSMIDFFLDTFEGTKRESMKEVLNNFLNSQKNKIEFKEFKRKRMVNTSVSENSYIDTKYNWIYKEREILKLHGDIDIKIFSDIFLILQDTDAYVFDDKTGTYYHFDKAYNSDLLYAIDNKIYYTSEDNRTIFVDELDLISREIHTHTINKATDNLVLSFMVCENGKLIIVEDNEQDETVDIYCNLTKLMSITDYDCVVGDILYDKISGSWLVIYEFENNTKAVRINKYGNYEEIQMPEFIESRLYLHGNILYYTKQDEISFYNVKKDTLNKKECEIATLDDRISIQGNKFVICNENGTYVYLKS